jgi:hypothetical protein
MQPILAPLIPGDQNDNVANLNKALLFFIDKNIIVADQPMVGRFFRFIEMINQDSSSYSDPTQFFVMLFQQQHELEPRGEVDQPTADSMNRFLIELGVLDHSVTGQVTNENGEPIPDMSVVAFDKDHEDTFGRAVTTPDGTYHINYDASSIRNFNKEFMDLLVKVFGPDGSLLATSEIISKPERVEVLNILVRNNENLPFKVSGFVFNKKGEPLAGQQVIAFDVDLRGARIYKKAQSLQELADNRGLEKLGTDQTTEKGYYEILFDRPSFAAAEIALADVVVYTISDERITGRSRLALDADYSKDGIIEGLNILVEDTEKRGKPEYARLMESIQPYLAQNEMSLVELHDSDEQIEFLARECGIDISLVILLVEGAQRKFELEHEESLQNDLEPLQVQAFFHEFLYGIGRQNIQLKWQELLVISPEDIHAAFAIASEQNITRDFSEAERNNNIEALQLGAREFIFNNKLNNTKVPVKEILSLGLTAENGNAEPLQRALLKNLTSFNGDPGTFWTEHLPSQPGFVDRPDLIKSLQLTSQLGSLTGMHLPLMKKLQQDRQITSVKQLVKLTDNDWKAVLADTGVPEEITGADEEDKINRYGAAIKTILQAAYPTEKIALMISENEVKIEDAGIKEKLSAFFAKAPEFNFATSRLDNFSDELKEVSGEEYEGARTALLALQRIFQVSPSPEIMAVLHQEHLDSAYKISSINESAFITMYAEKLGGVDSALAVHQRASHQATRIAEIATAVHEATNIDTPYAVMGANKDPENTTADLAMGAGQSKTVRDVVKKNIPSYENIFGRPDLCECQQCRSVYSPSAYFVDLMRFLQGSKKNEGGKTPLDVLFARRPDLGELQLTCENSNTLLPYIDLANEVMEFFVVHKKLDASAANNTADETEKELRATPQNTNIEAYRQIKNQYFPFTLPYHQPLDVIRTYLKQTGCSRYELMEYFHPDDTPPTQAALDAEWLTISAEEYGLLTGKTFDGQDSAAAVFACYGYQDLDSMQADIFKVNAFLNRTGIKYTDLIDLLNTKFCNPHRSTLDFLQELLSGISGGSKSLYETLRQIKDDPDPIPDGEIKTMVESKGVEAVVFKTWLRDNFDNFRSVMTLFQLDSLCDLEATEIKNIKSIYENTNGTGLANGEFQEYFVRVSSFIRLWRKTGYTIQELDVLLTALDEKNISPALIHKLSVAKKINGLLKLPLNQLAILWGKIDLAGKNSLYSKLFLSKSITKTAAAFKADKNGHYLTDANQKIIDNIPAILAAFKITGEEYNAIASHIFVRTDAGMEKFDKENAILNIENLSMLYRYSILAKALKIRVDELCKVMDLFDLKPFSIYHKTLHTFEDVNPQSTLNSIKQVNSISDSGFKIDTLDLIFTGNETALSSSVKEENILSAAKLLRDGFSLIDKEQLPVADAELTEDFLRNKISRVFTTELTEKLFEIFKGNYSLSKKTDKNLNIVLPPPLDQRCVYDRISGKITFKGLMQEDEKNQLTALANSSEDFKTTVAKLFITSQQLLEGNKKVVKENLKFLFEDNQLDQAVIDYVEVKGFPANEVVMKRFEAFYLVFIPYLVKKLKEDLVVQQLAQLTTADESVVKILSKSALSSLMESIASEGLSGRYYKEKDFSQEAVPQTDAQINFNWLHKPIDLVQEDQFGVRWDGYLSAQSNQVISLVSQVAQADETVKVWMDDILIIDKKSEEANVLHEGEFAFTANKLHKLKIEYTEDTGKAGLSLSWKSDGMDKEIIPSNYLFPDKEITAFVQAVHAINRAVLFIKGFRLNSEEVGHFNAFAENFDHLNFTSLSSLHWNRIYDYTILRKHAVNENLSLPALFTLFKAANMPKDKTTALLQQISNTFNWNQTELEAMYAHLPIGKDDFKNERKLLKIASGLMLVAKTKMSASKLLQWSTLTVDFTELNILADEIKKAVRAKYEENDWLDVARQLSDKLRVNQRDALIACLLQQKEIQDENIIDANSLYEYFLIDVQMGACMDTSRIVQAYSAIQLFVSMCLLNRVNTKTDPSKVVTPDAIDTDKWEWMKLYRVWEVPRKIFVDLENFLEPEWRRDKSYMFKDLESECSQSDITDESMDVAFRHYLEKCIVVSDLEVCSFYQDTETDTLHVVGRTRATPYQYFYRIRDAREHWGAWEKIEADIRSVENGENSGVHILPVMWKKRLYLFWPEFLKKQKEKKEELQIGQGMAKVSVEDLKAEEYWEVRLAYSEYKNGKWSPKSLSKEFLKAPDFPENTTKTASEKGGLVGDGFVNFLDKGSLSNNLFIYTDKVHLVKLKLTVSDTLLDFDLRLLDVASYGNIQLYGSVNYLLTANKNNMGVVVSKKIDETTKSFNSEYAPFYSSYRKSGKVQLFGNEYLGNGGNHAITFSNNLSLSNVTTKHHFFFQNGNFAYYAKAVPIKLKEQIQSPDNASFKGLVSDSLKSIVTLKNVMGDESFQFTAQKEFATSDILSKHTFLTQTKAQTEVGMSAKGLLASADLNAGQPVSLLKASSKNFSDEVKTAASFNLNYIINEPYSASYKLKDSIGYKFQPFYHPYASDFIRELNVGGINNLMNADTNHAKFGSDKGAFFKNTFAPNYLQNNVNSLVQGPLPAIDIDFDEFGSQSHYNYELFFHVPYFIANQCRKNGKYREAMKWFHYIFDPTTNEAPDPADPTKRFWKVLPFRNIDTKEKMEEYFKKLQPETDPDSTTPSDSRIEEWRKHPFDPHIIARGRPLAYMKNVVVKYVENLIAWADDLFMKFTRESITEAIQLYIIAGHTMGRRPEFVPKRGKIKPESFNSLKDKWDSFSNALVQLENLFPFTSEVTIAPSGTAINLLGIGRDLYFCIPSNEKMLSLWDTVEDRLFKIRHCQDINGIERKLALLDPSIDPALLVGALAKGMSLGSILNNLSSPAPFHRFNFLLAKASEFCGHVIAISNACLSATEKKEAEELTRLRGIHEKNMLDQITAIKKKQIFEAKVNIEGLLKSRETAQKRLQHYLDLLGETGVTVGDPPSIPAEVDNNSLLPLDTIIKDIVPDVNVSLVDGSESGVKLIPKEKEELDRSRESQQLQMDIASMEIMANYMHLIPEMTADGKPFGIGAGVAFGGKALGWALSSMAKAKQVQAGNLSYQANLAYRMTSYIRRDQDWVFQTKMASSEIIQVDKQIAAAEVRFQIAQKDLTNHLQQIKHAQEIETFLDTKFTNTEMYQWMKTRLSTVCKQSYDLAYNMALAAQKAYCFELGKKDASFIHFGYWDNGYQGLTAGEQLQLALRQMEKSYLEENRRDFELTKNVSLNQLDSNALLQLKFVGTCEFQLPEELFDLDYPGHYSRKIKSVSITIPCVVGPYTTLNSTLRLLKNTVRINSSGSSYIHNNEEGIPVDDGRFDENNIPFKSIATSSAQNDSGVFELNFRDDRYLPFEGAGVVSTWKLELNGKQKKEDGSILDFSQFNINSISDVILHIKYTAKEDAGSFKTKCIENLDSFINGSVESNSVPFMKQLSLKHDFPNDFHRLMNPIGEIQSTEFTINKNNFNWLMVNRRIKLLQLQAFIIPAKQKTISRTPDMVFDGHQSSEWIQAFNSLKRTTVSIPDEYDPTKKVTLQFGTNLTNGLKKEEVDDILFILYYIAGDNEE